MIFIYIMIYIQGHSSIVCEKTLPTAKETPTADEQSQDGIADHEKGTKLMGYLTCV